MTEKQFYNLPGWVIEKNWKSFRATLPIYDKDGKWQGQLSGAGVTEDEAKDAALMQASHKTLDFLSQ